MVTSEVYGGTDRQKTVPHQGPAIVTLISLGGVEATTNRPTSGNAYAVPPVACRWANEDRRQPATRTTLDTPQEPKTECHEGYSYLERLDRIDYLSECLRLTDFFLLAVGFPSSNMGTGGQHVAWLWHMFATDGGPFSNVIPPSLDESMEESDID
ncbi:MAG: hypothetical protein LQ352_003284 [Teloschistes flavicans]|nr:MAG: hypothetical protein LQ352_003284 [Teloschistes flavicans]